MKSHLTPQIKALLDGLRWRIRAYVWLEGLALVVAVLGLLYWFALGLDFLPVLLGASELPTTVRLLLLVAAGGAAAAILYYWVLRRAFVELPDRSMALLLERKHADFHDSLVTAVELGEEPHHAETFNEEMLDHTSAEAQARLDRVDANRVFNFFPLLRNVGLAVLAVGSIGLFALLSSDAFGKSVERLVLLSEEPWPRRAQVEVIGIEVLRPVPASEVVEGQPALRTTRLSFPDDKTLKVAKGTDVRLLVRGSGPAGDLPDYCSVFYSTSEVSFAGVTMRKAGPERKGAENLVTQEYLVDSSPFKKMIGSLEFDVLGYGRSSTGSALGTWPVTNRVRGYRIEIVESPTLAEVMVVLQYPAYTGRLPEVRRLTTAMVIPIGTQVTLAATANKPLQTVQVQARQGEQAQAETVPVGAQFSKGDPELTALLKAKTPSPAEERFTFEYRIPRLMENAALDFVLTDADGVQNLQPFRVALTVVPDEAPKLDVALKGIGTAITPEAILPMRGTLTDDYGVAKTWFQIRRVERRVGSKVEPVDEPARTFAFPAPTGDVLTSSLDLQVEAQRKAEENPFKLEPDDKIEISVQASDRYDLNGPDQPNVGEGGKTTLEVVDAARFQQLLDAGELSLRRRFEQIVEEMSQARDSIARVRADYEGDTGPLKGVEPEDVLPKKPAEGEAPAGPSATNPDGDEGGAVLTPEQLLERAAGLRMLRVQRGYQHTERAAGEVNGVAIQFEDLHDELVNNRIQAADRQNRYKRELAEPLHQIAQLHLPELTRRLRVLEEKLADPKAGAAESKAALDQADLVLLEMHKVLQKMLEFETYNELVEMLRKLIAEEDELIEATRQQNKRRVLGEE